MTTSDTPFTTAVVIPARYESSRFPGKPMAMIQGISLLQRTYMRVKEAKSVSEIFIATDDERIEAHAKSFGAEVIMTSPSCPTGTDRIAEAVRLNPSLQRFDCIVNVQGDEPCISQSTIQEVIDLLRSRRDVDIATAVTPITNDKDLLSPNIVKCVLSKSNTILYFSRMAIPGNKRLQPTTTGRTPYFRHIGIYAFRPKSLLRFSELHATPLQLEEDVEALRALEYDMKLAAIHVKINAPGVDTPEDIEAVELWLKNEQTEERPSLT